MDIFGFEVLYKLKDWEGDKGSPSRDVVYGFYGDKWKVRVHACAGEVDCYLTLFFMRGDTEVAGESEI